jgi:uncharacterized protein (TIGR02118 family)
MVTLMCFLKRKPGTSEEEFVRHWYDRHGPLIASTPEIARHVLRYEQFRPSADMPGFSAEGFDGVTVMTFESADTFKAFLGEPSYAEKVYADEEAFLDRDGLVWMVADEPRVVIGASAP